MIAIILVIFGILFSILGLIGLFAIAIAPLIDDWDVVVRRKDDSLFYQTRFGKWILIQRTKKMAWEYFAILVLGVVLFITGMYLGFADRGKDFWFYKKIYGEEIDTNKWDNLTDEGFYEDPEGKVYRNFILIRGDKIYFNGANETDIVENTELDNMLSKIAQENTIALIDSYAVSATYKDVRDKIKSKGFECKEEYEP